MSVYKTKNTIVEAVQFKSFNNKVCLEFCPKAVTVTDPLDLNLSLIVTTPIGEVRCLMLDWIVKDEDGDFYVTDSANEMWNRYEEIQDGSGTGEVKQFKVKPSIVKAIQYTTKNYRELATFIGIPKDGKIEKADLEKCLSEFGLEKDVWVIMYSNGDLGMLKNESFKKQFEPFNPIVS